MRPCYLPFFYLVKQQKIINNRHTNINYLIKQLI